VTSSSATATVARRRSLPDEAGVIIALLVLVTIVGLLRPSFLKPETLFQQLSGAAFIGMLALGMVFVVAIRDIDLSVGWMFNFSAVIAAKAMVAGLDPWLGVLVGIAFGGLLGLVNGVLAIRLRIPVIIITLGTFSAFRGLSLVVNESRAVIPPDKEHLFFTLMQTKVLGLIPLVAILFVVLAIALHVLLHYTRFGYRVQAMGSNPDAARLAGIPVDRTRVQARDHGLGRDDGREVEHPADRQVDVADGDDEHHPEREHPDERGAGQLLEERGWLEEVGPERADDRDEHQEGDDDAGLVGEGAAPCATGRDALLGRQRVRRGRSDGHLSPRFAAVPATRAATGFTATGTSLYCRRERTIPEPLVVSRG